MYQSCGEGSAGLVGFGGQNGLTATMCSRLTGRRVSFESSVGSCMDEVMSPSHAAIEMNDLESLRDLLDGGADIHEEYGGMTLLHHAVDSEIDWHGQTGKPLGVSITAYLVARGADPKRKSHSGKGLSSEHVAFTSGHWLATALFDGWSSR